MKKQLLILLGLLALATPVVAGDISLSWTAPTQNTDGTPYVDPDGYKVYYGLTNGGPYPTIIDVPDPATLTVDVLGLTSATYYFVATAYNTSAQESGFSNQAIKTITSLPNPPLNLTIQDLVVYTVIKQENKFVLLPVGTAPAGTTCDTTQSVNGKYAVPRDQVTWSGTIEPLVVVAQCG